MVRGGRYEVVASYGCDPADAGGAFRVAAGRAVLDGVVEATAGRTVFERRRLGFLDLQPGKTVLSVSAVSAKGKELMALNRIWLRGTN